MIIFVGSQNPVKINAVIRAASETWPNVEVRGLNIPSGINEQPITDEETRTGAENRALKALEDGLNLYNSNPNLSSKADLDLGVLGLGMEGGVFTSEDGTLWNTVWAAVADSHGFMTVANGQRFELKDPLASAIKSGKEMGPALSSMTGVSEINRQQGMIGIVTNGFSDRTEEYAGLAKLTLGLWYGRNWPVSVRSTTPQV